MKMTRVLAFAASLLAGVPLAATAQDAGAPAQPEAQPEAQSEADAQPWSMTWTEPVFEQLAQQIIGSWKTTGPVDEFGDPSQQAEVLMSVSPAKLSQLPDAMYVECARADSPERPYRQAFLQLYRRQGEIRLRTLEVRGAGNPVSGMLVGLWAAPDLIPDVPRDDLIATLDLQFSKAGAGWVGETPYPYPTAVGGAVEMTSRMKLGGDRIETSDRGYGADGAVLWGPAKDESYVFERVDPYVSVDRRKSGVVIITLKDNTETTPFADGDRVAFQYTGWLTDGRMFDTSRRPNRNPLTYVSPSGSIIPGWQIATEGMSEGDWRKFVLPSKLAYGPNSAARGAIPPNSTLVFEAECVLVKAGEIKLPTNIVEPGEKPQNKPDGDK